MTTVQGYQHSVGIYTVPETGEHIEYDNYNLHITTDENPAITGVSCDIVKIKKNEFNRIAGTETPDSLIGKEVIFQTTFVKGKPILSRIYLAEKGK